MAYPWENWVLEQTRARDITAVETVQSLWGGYGELLRVSLEAGPAESVILKRVAPPPIDRESESDQRKRRSYQVERNWYREGASHCDEQCRVAHCWGEASDGEGSLLLLEDLGCSGFLPYRNPGIHRLRSGLGWLAHFHARFLGKIPKGLWERGSYWHLGTRREQWRDTPPGPLKEHAEKLDACLRTAQFQTLLHGDPKPPNFCWRDNHPAAVDFQYVGAGCGIRDVSLYISRCLTERSMRECDKWLDYYFGELRSALECLNRGQFATAVEADWRPRFPAAWADYARFCAGWSPGYRADEFTMLMLERALGPGVLYPAENRPTC